MASLLWTSTLLSAALADQSITCFEDDQKCKVANGNLIEMQVETTWQECSLLCQDEPTCLVFNFFGPNSNFHPHIVHYCTLSLFDIWVTRQIANGQYKDYLDG